MKHNPAASTPASKTTTPLRCKNRSKKLLTNEPQYSYTRKLAQILEYIPLLIRHKAKSINSSENNPIELQKEICFLIKHNDELQKEIVHKSNTILLFQNKLTNLQNKYDTLSKQNKDLQLRLSALSVELNECNGINKSLKRINQSQKNEIINIQETVASLHKTIEKQLKEKADMILQFMAKIQFLNTKIDGQNKKMENYKQQINKVVKEAEAQGNLNTTLNNQLEEYKDSFNTAHALSSIILSTRNASSHSGSALARNYVSNQNKALVKYTEEDKSMNEDESILFSNSDIEKLKSEITRLNMIILDYKIEKMVGSNVKKLNRNTLKEIIKNS